MADPDRVRPLIRRAFAASKQAAKTGLSTGVVNCSKGQVRGFVEFAKKPGSLLSNPSLLAGAECG